MKITAIIMYEFTDIIICTVYYTHCFFQLYRHGDRSPYILIPNDINNTEDTWPQGIGEMTPVQ